MKKVLFLVTFLFFLFQKEYAQENLLPNPGFENGNIVDATCDYDGVFPNPSDGDISGKIDNWNTDVNWGKAFSVHTYSSPNWCQYSPPPFPGNNYYMHLVFGNTDNNRTRRDHIWAGFNATLQPNTSYVLRLQVEDDNLVNSGSISYAWGPIDVVGVIFSKYGEHWYQHWGNTRVVINNAINIPTSQYPYILYEIIFSSNLGNSSQLKNIVFIMNSGGVDIDNVELFAACPDNIEIQNKDYYYGTGYNAKDYIIAGNNVGAPGPTGNVTVHNGGNIGYEAGGHVELDPGFSVEAGGVFTAQIAPCQSLIIHSPENDTSMHIETNTITLTCPIDTLHIVGIDGDTTAYKTWFWNLGNGQTSTSSHPSVYYTTPGTDTITLYGTDSTGHIDTVTEYVVVPDCNGHRAIHTKNNSSDSTLLNNTLTGSGLTVQPNPSNGNILLSINEQNDGIVKYIYLYNIYGQLVYQTTSSQNAINIDLSNYSAGQYLIRVQSGGNSWCKKVVKE